MDNYTIRYRIQLLNKYKIAIVKISLPDNEAAIALCKEIELDGNYVEELHNTSTKSCIYHHKKARYNHILNNG